MSPVKPIWIMPLLALAALGGASAQVPPSDPVQLQRALAAARAAGAAAGRRAAELEAQASTANAAVERTAREAAGIAARIQQAEAGIAANEARAALIERDRAQLRARLAQRQQPLVRLTAALQRLARRPAGLALLRPGSLHDTVYLRAALEAMLPEVKRRTADLRAELDRSRALQAQARANSAGLTPRSEVSLRGVRRWPRWKAANGLRRAPPEGWRRARPSGPWPLLNRRAT